MHKKKWLILILFFMGFVFSMKAHAATKDYGYDPELKSAVAGIGKKYALVIGIENKKNRLIWAVDDAVEIGWLLKQDFGFDVTCAITRYPSAPGRKNHAEKLDALVGKRYTDRNGILNLFDEIVRNTRKNDQVLIYFSGHGKPDKYSNEVGYLIPYSGNLEKPSATLINMDKFASMSKRLQAKHVLFILDSCYSGIAGAFSTMSRQNPEDHSAEDIRQMMGSRARHILTAGETDKKAIMLPDKEMSAFSFYLKRALESEAGIRRADFTRDGVILASELKLYLSDKMGKDNRVKHKPCFFNYTEDSGEFVFVPDGYGKGLSEAGKLEVRSDPSGAKIFIQDEFKGTAPLKIAGLTPATYPVTAKSGQDSRMKTVTVQANRKAVVSFSFDPGPRMNGLYVMTRPADCRVRILNIRDKFYNGIFLKTGRYKLEVSKPEYKTKFQWIDVLGTEGMDVYVELDPLPVQSVEDHSPWTDPTTGMKFVWVPEGCYQMGQTEAEKRYLIKEAGEKKYKKYFERELPRHEVCVDAFYMAKMEVTRGQFRHFIKETGYRTDADKKGKAYILNKETDWKYKEMPGYNWEKTGYSQDDSHPVACVSWNDARAFIKWLSKKTGQNFSLPSEAQWEYAARGGTDFMRFWGTNDADACKYANVADKGSNWNLSFPCSDGYEFTSPVGNYKPNPFGLNDMLGNVWEWCEDVYDKNAYSKHDRNNPVVTSGGSSRVYRGGSWRNTPRNVRAAHRSRVPAVNRHSYLGFRLCLSRVRQ